MADIEFYHSIISKLIHQKLFIRNKKEQNIQIRYQLSMIKKVRKIRLRKYKKSDRQQMP